MYGEPSTSYGTLGSNHDEDAAEAEGTWFASIASRFSNACATPLYIDEDVRNTRLGLVLGALHISGPSPHTHLPLGKGLLYSCVQEVGGTLPCSSASTWCARPYGITPERQPMLAGRIVATCQQVAPKGESETLLWYCGYVWSIQWFKGSKSITILRIAPSYRCHSPTSWFSSPLRPRRMHATLTALC